MFVALAGVISSRVQKSAESEVQVITPFTRCRTRVRDEDGRIGRGHEKSERIVARFAICVFALSVIDDDFTRRSRERDESSLFCKIREKRKRAGTWKRYISRNDE